MKRLFFASYPFLLFVFLISIFFRPITAINDDLGRHILLGNLILSTHTVPSTNLLSYAFYNYPFVNTTWLYEVLIAFTAKILGTNGLLFLSCIIAISACVILYRFSIRRFSKSSVFVVSSVYVLLLSLRTDVRPEIFSMLFLSLFVVLLYRFFEKPTRHIFLLVPLEILWVNMHIYFFAGPILVCIFLIDSMIEGFTNKSKQLALVFLGTAIATLFNPNGIKGAIFPLVVLQNYGFPVVENQTAFTLFHIYQNTAVFLPLVVIEMLVLLIFVGREKVTLRDVLLVTFFGILTVLNFRNILLLIFTTFIFSTCLLDYVLKKFKKIIKKFPAHSFAALYPLSIFFIVVIIAKDITVHGVGFGEIEYGKESVDFLLQNNISGPIFNDFNIGGYLSYRIYPRLVFVDNRPEAYPKQFFKDVYIPMVNTPEIFKKIDKRYKFNSIIVSHYDGTNYKNNLLTYFVNKSDFVIVYLDSYAMILVKKTPKNENLIKKYQIDKASFKVEPTDEKTLFRYLLFFEKVGWN